MAGDSQYTPTIGIETHVQLKTATKLFAAVGNDAREAPPNSLISHICVGMPGALPVLNAEAVHLAIRAGVALQAKINSFSKFERKHYFYPDLPKGYQISQYEQPIVGEGKVEIIVDGSPKEIGIIRAHLEEDAGKNTHPVGADYSLVDLNRAGTPLLEIVSQPDMHSAAEAKAYARELYLLMKFAGVSDCDLYYGNMRFDVNVSVSADPNQLGKRAEVKNLNSFRAVENAVNFEIKRQIEILESGQSVIQETRGWDDAAQKTTSQRNKEEAEDYRYMPEPDVPPIVLDDDSIHTAQQEIKLPSQWRQQLGSLGLPGAQIETLLDAQVESDGNNYLEIVSADEQSAKATANSLINTVIPASREGKVKLPVNDWPKLIKSISQIGEAGKISSSGAKELMLKSLAEISLPANLEEFGSEYIQVSDESEIDRIVAEVISENAKAAEDVKNGEMKAIGFLTGQVMKKSQGKANPGLAQELIKKQLGIS